jgi:hypothetical protein
MTYVLQFQTLIAGLVGFSGVILTLAFNAYLSRAQEERRVNRDRSSLRIALIEELKVQRDALVRDVESMSAAEDGVLPIQRYSDAFDRSMDRLGMLGDVEVNAIFAAYCPLRALTPKLRLLGLLSGQPSADGHWAQVSQNNLDTVRKMHQSHIPPIEAAILVLQSQARSSG